MGNSIFRAYDVRGLYPSEINERVVSGIAAALAKFFKKGKIVIAYDVRLSSPDLYRAVIESLSSSGKHEVIKTGLATTPMFYFLVNYLKAEGGIMITASHNPKEYNGMKVVGKGAMPMSGKEIKKIMSESN